MSNVPHVPWLARAAATFVLPLSVMFGGWCGAYAAIAIKVIQYDGWRRVPDIAFGAWWLPEVPVWFGAEQKSSTGLLEFILVTVTACACVYFGVTLWKYVVVRRLGWMTDQDAEAYLKRAGDP